MAEFQYQRGQSEDICQHCLTARVACTVVRSMMDFERGDWDHGMKHSRQICCKACKDKGCSVRSPGLYQCTHDGCG